MPAIRPAVSPFVALALLAHVLAAQQLPRAAADSARVDSARAARLARIVVSGARLAPSADPRLPQRADAIALDRTRGAAGVAGVAEVLQRIPGVSVSNDQGSRAQPTLDLRGFTLSPVVGVPQGVSVFLDGVRVNEPDAQEVNFDLLPMEAVERAELVRGASAVFGKNTLAGAVNLQTSRGGLTPELRTGVDVGPFGERSAHVVASGVAGGVDGLVMLRGGAEGGYQERSGGRSRQAFATVGRRSESGDLALSVLYARDRLYEAGSLPESWLSVARRANFTGGDFFAPELAQVGVRGETMARGAHLRGTAYARRNAIEQLNVNAGSANTRAFVRNGSVGATGELTFAGRVVGRPLDLTVGSEGSRSMVRYRVLAEPNEVAPDSPPGCDAGAGGGAALCEDAHVDGDDAALYAQGLLQASPRVALLLSARGDYARVPFRDGREPANDGTSVFTRLSPRLGVTVTPAAGARMYASVGSAFRAPAALELACASADAACPLPFSLGADPPLAPVVAWSYEAGADLTGSDRTLSLALFDTEVRDEIVFVSAGRAAGFFQNIPRSRRRGLEASASRLLPPAIRLFGAYTLVDATYGSTVALASPLADNVVTPGSRFPLSPRHRGSLGAEVERAAGRTLLGAGLTARGVSSSYLRGDEANRMAPLAGYVVADLRLSARRDRLAITIVADNILDRRYSVYGVYAENPKGPYGGPAPAEAQIERFFTPAYPRTVHVSVAIEP